LRKSVDEIKRQRNSQREQGYTSWRQVSVNVFVCGSALHKKCLFVWAKKTDQLKEHWSGKNNSLTSLTTQSYTFLIFLQDAIMNETEKTGVKALICPI
jgi:hypothetical protein